MLVQHHIKYKEIHGVDETVWMTRSEHKALHHRLRKEGKCKNPPSELNIISSRAHARTKEFKELQKKNAKNIYRFRFNTTIAPNISLIEEIKCYIKTGETDEILASELSISTKQAGTVFITCHPNMPATAGTKTMFGDGGLDTSPSLPPFHQSQSLQPLLTRQKIVALWRQETKNMGD